MASLTFHDRRAAAIENRELRVTVLEGGGHIAEIFDKQTGVNPLWIPPWRSIEPSAFDASMHAEYGSGSDARLLAGIMGHNLCLDIFGGPSDEEVAAGLTAHGEASVVTYAIDARTDRLVMRAALPIAQLRIERQIELHGRAVQIREVVENLSGSDRPIGWTEHVTLGPPFLRKGATEFRASATQSLVFEHRFGTADYLTAAARFDWPEAPRIGGGTVDLRRLTDAPASSAFTTHLMSPQRDPAYFVAWSPESRLAFGYVWQPADFPWLGIWEENHSRSIPPWNGRTLTRGMEFGVSPIPESRRQMIERGRLFDVQTYLWIPAKSQVSVEYWAVLQPADAVPETLDWPA